MLFCRKFASNKLILRLPIHLKIWYTSLCELVNKNIPKQLNLNLKMLKTISLSDIKFSQIRVKNDYLHLRPHLNNWYECLGDPKDPIWDQIQLLRVKPKRQFSENVIFVLVSIRKDRCLKCCAFSKGITWKTESNFPSNENQKFWC